MSVSAPRAESTAPQTDEKTTAFLRKTFREYYFRHHGDVEVPTMIESREFGYIPFGKGMIRHLSYNSPGDLAADLVKQAPSSVFCSNGTYSDPTLPMDEKGWKGAELIFDIDANDIPTTCRAKHSFWTCKDCGKIMRSAERPEHCSKCQGVSLVQLHWSCGVCLAAAKEQAGRLIGFLTNDFGVPNDRISVYFSGNRGYHLHVDDKRFEPLEPSARAQIANYIKGTGLVRPQGAEYTFAGGWAGRIATAGLGQSSKLEPAVAAFGSRIDESVTTDIHRIFRMPGTLHGNSGLLKARVHDLQAFKPEYDPVVLGDDEIEVSVRGSPAFTLRGRTFGPYSGEEATVPTYAAVYMMTKGLAQVLT